MCNQDCAQGPTHANYECKAFQAVGFKAPDFSSAEEYRQLRFNPYCFITTLRCILMRGQSPLEWEDLQELRDHNMERRAFDEQGWLDHEEEVSAFLTQSLKLTHANGALVTAEEVHRTIGILSTNNANFCMGDDFGKGAGLYPTYARVNHGCWCNTKTLKYKDNRLELRASEPIKKGQEIVNQYVKPNIGTVSRRLILRNKWHFDCDCKRCADPTEFGSMLSAILCQDCEIGCVLPQEPLVPDYPWKCQDCGLSVDVDRVSEVLMEADEAIKMNKGNKEQYDIVQHYEKYLYDQSKHLHWQNYILINAKMKLGLLYGNIKPYTYENLTRSQLERKSQVCQDVLDTMSKVDTGYTSWRTSMLSEITKTKILLAKQDFKAGRIPQSELQNILASEKMLKCYLAYHQRLFFGSRSD